MRPYALALIAAVALHGCAQPPKVAEAPPPPPPPSPTPPTQNAPMCARPQEKAAFDVSALKSHLMVTAVTCHTEERYNAFIHQFQPYLATNEKTLSGFFQRAYGRRAQSSQDDYITNLANAQSQLGVKAGTLFCSYNLGMFDEVMQVKAGQDLPSFSQSKPIQQAMAVQECPPPAPPKAAPAKTTPPKKP